MPQKTREQKIKAASRNHTPTHVHAQHHAGLKPSAKKTLDKTSSNRKVETAETEEDKMTRRYFVADFRKSLIITVSILAFEVAIRYVQLDRILAGYFKM